MVIRVTGSMPAFHTVKMYFGCAGCANVNNVLRLVFVIKELIFDNDPFRRFVSGVVIAHKTQCIILNRGRCRATVLAGAHDNSHLHCHQHALIVARYRVAIGQHSANYSRLLSLLQNERG